MRVVSVAIVIHVDDGNLHVQYAMLMTSSGRNLRAPVSVIKITPMCTMACTEVDRDDEAL